MPRNNLNKEIQQHQQILEVRRADLKPTPVLHNKIPNWMRKKLLARKKEGSIDPFYNATDNGSLLQAVEIHVKQQTGNNSWLDHEGTTKVGDHQVFVNEPYWYYHEPNRLLAELLDCEWCVFANSLWLPGRTIRIAFWPKEIKNFEIGRLA